MTISFQKDPNHIILHVGLHELTLHRTSEDIPTSIIDPACSMKDKNCDENIVLMSNIILRTGNKKLSQKGQEVNTHLKEVCKEKKIYLIDNTNKIKAQHLNKGKFHLNNRGSNVLSNAFISELSRILT